MTLRKAFLHFCFSFAVVTAMVTIAAAPAVSQPAQLQLYTLYGGRLDFKNLGPFSDTGGYAGKTGTMADPCFLIHHGHDWMLWDMGLGDKIAAMPRGKNEFGFHWTVQKTVRAQLAQIGLKPGDIKYVALSHVHPDHIGNVGLFPHATFLVSPLDLSWGRQVPPPPGVDPRLLQTLRRMKIKPVPFDLDVFGDGSVIMLRTAGHTPGHHSLLLKLPKTGPVLISGDLFHLREDYEKSLLPVANDSRAETLASMQRFRSLAKNYHARVVIQHDPGDFRAMPAFPAYLD